MPNQPPAQIRFDQMAEEAANETIKDLPALLCGTCGCAQRLAVRTTLKTKISLF